MLREKAIEDERPAYVHGNQLLSLVMKEQMSWMAAAISRASEARKVDEIGKDVETNRLNKKSVGWLRYLFRKCVTKDDWSEDGEPHEWWDRVREPLSLSLSLSSSTDSNKNTYNKQNTFAPMASFPRFDLHESSYFVHTRDSLY